MHLLNRIFRKEHPKVVYLDDYKNQKRREALSELPYMDEWEWRKKYKRHLKHGKYRF